MIHLHEHTALVLSKLIRAGYNVTSLKQSVSQTIGQAVNKPLDLISALLGALNFSLTSNKMVQII